LAYYLGGVTLNRKWGDFERYRLDLPVPQRRGTWKFVGVNAKEW